MEALARKRIYGEPLRVEFFSMAQLALSTLKRTYRQGQGILDLDTALDPVHARIIQHFLKDPKLIAAVLENFEDLTDQRMADDLVKQRRDAVVVQQNPLVSQEQREFQDFEDTLMETMIGIPPSCSSAVARLNLKMSMEIPSMLPIEKATSFLRWFRSGKQGMANLFIKGLQRMPPNCKCSLFTPDAILKERATDGGDVLEMKLNTVEGRKAMWRVLFKTYNEEFRERFLWAVLITPASSIKSSRLPS